jgi:hypothetical protein
MVAGRVGAQQFGVQGTAADDDRRVVGEVVADSDEPLRRRSGGKSASVASRATRGPDLSRLRLAQPASPDLDRAFGAQAVGVAAGARVGALGEVAGLEQAGDVAAEGGEVAEAVEVRDQESGVDGAGDDGRHRHAAYVVVAFVAGG